VLKNSLKYFLKAMADVDAHLTLVGDGSERERTEALATEIDFDATFLGEASIWPLEKARRFFHAM